MLVTGGAGTIGTAVVRRLLRDGIAVRVADQRPAPDWMREAAEIHTGDLRDTDEARRALAGCDRIVHLAAIVGGIANFHKLPYTLLETNTGLYNALFRAAIEGEVERFVYVSSSMVFERAKEFPTPEDYLERCPTPRSAYGFSKLAGEYWCRAAADEFGLRYSIVRPVQRVRAGGDAGRRAGHRAHRARPDRARAAARAAVPDLRLGRRRPARSLTSTTSRTASPPRSRTTPRSARTSTCPRRTS